MAENANDRKVSDVAKREEEILDFWEKNQIFEKSEEKQAPNGEFVFYDGPPFATGLPHYGHLLAGTIKDAIPRYKTMQGYSVRRKWGWDCHGLPLENLIEKQLDLKSKRDIEELGIDVFNKTARDNVMTYADDWKRIVPRMGRWVDMEDDYKTMDATYTESVWWAFSELTKKGLVNEGFKPMHLCPRCGTTLSNFEVAQNYQDIKDFSVTVKLELVNEKNTFLLAWTTTPWTLPGNMAAAVHQDEDYVAVELETGETVILGKERVEDVFTKRDISYNIVREFKGKELIGQSYKPPFDYYRDEEFDNKENAWKVWHADYVSMEDGVGLVHIAPAFGAEDMELAEQNGIPIVHHVGTDGTFVDTVTDFAGLSVKPKDDKKSGVDHMQTDVEIIKKLAHDGVLFHKEKIEHSYPHCWRCDTPLLNYAASSWFVTAPKIKDQLIEQNSKVGWVPADIREGRMGKWLEGTRDWAISRSRYWGAPIPVWKTPKGEAVTISSVEDLKGLTKKSGNNYYIMRHGESELNTRGILNAKLDVDNPVTKTGYEQIEEAVSELQNANIDLIVHSPLQRTKETAEAVRKSLGLEQNQMTMIAELQEIGMGEFEGKSRDEYVAFFGTGLNRLKKPPEGGESWLSVRKRASKVLYELERDHEGKNILIVSHNGVLQMLQAGAYGLDEKTTGEKIEHDSLDLRNAEVRKVDFVPLPHNENYELDLHRPFIDEVYLEKDGEKLERVPDVFDCWFESGSMSYGQFHYPFENLDEFNPPKGVGYPADFIAEGLDQTRGWFYSMLVLGTALFGQSPYKNVIVNGLVLAEDGKKMSKSLQNYPDPMIVADTYGVDAMRYYMLTSPVVRGEDLAFSEKGVAEVQRKNIGRLGNVLSFYELYKADAKHEANDSSDHVLDRWVIARLNQTIALVTKGMENYELDRATRPIGEFIDDLSTWYIRRSRDRFKGEDEADKALALGTTLHVLTELSKVIAPVMPFYAEHLYRSVCTAEESVHLDHWPETEEIDESVLEEMTKVRDLITLALEARDKAGMKVRQPLASVTIPEKELDQNLADIMKDELNVKEVLFGSELSLDTNLTDELISEGQYRDLLRRVQELRKRAKLQPSDVVDLKITTDDSGASLVETWKSDLQKVAGLSNIQFVDNVDSEEFKVGESSFKLALK